MENMCPVCGYNMEDPPHDFNICPSCGTEFGNSDVNASIKELRSAWLRSGAKWWSPVDIPPDGWDPYEQVSDLLDRPRQHASIVWFSGGLQSMIAGENYRRRGNPNLESASLLPPPSQQEKAAIAA